MSDQDKPKPSPLSNPPSNPQPVQPDWKLDSPINLQLDAQLDAIDRILHRQDMDQPTPAAGKAPSSPNPLRPVIQTSPPAERPLAPVIHLPPVLIADRQLARDIAAETRDIMGLLLESSSCDCGCRDGESDPAAEASPKHLLPSILKAVGSRVGSTIRREMLQSGKTSTTPRDRMMALAVQYDRLVRQFEEDHGLTTAEILWILAQGLGVRIELLEHTSPKRKPAEKLGPDHGHGDLDVH